MTDFWYNVGDIFQSTFKYFLEPLGNLPNVIFFLLLLGGMFYWMFVVQKRFTKKAKDSGGLI